MRKVLESDMLRRKAKKLYTNARGERVPLSALWGEYGLKVPPKPRFQGLQGVFWYAISQFVRKDEFLRFGGECVDGCGRHISDWHAADCGHCVASSRGFRTRFLRQNLGLQTKYCNNPIFSPDSSLGFGVTIDKRYGKGTAAKIKDMLKLPPLSEYSPKEYDKQIRLYLQMFYELGVDKTQADG